MRPIEVLICLIALLSAQPASSAQAPDDLAAIINQFRDTADDWQRVAAFLARQGKWSDAAKAQERAVERDPAGSRLLLARYQLHARDEEAAAETLQRVGQSRASRWLRVELDLVRDDVGAAERDLQEATGSDFLPEDDHAANLLYCGQSLRAADVDDALRARIALAREESQQALALARKIGGRARFPDARILASRALEQMGEAEKALEELEALRSNPIPPQTHCPGVLADRVLFNEANLAARSGSGDRSPVDLYREAIMVAAARESRFRDAVTMAGLPLESALSYVLLAARRDPDNAAPEARNNLGQFLLKTALRTDNEVTRGKMLVDAIKAFTAAASNPNYATRQYAFAGLARASLAVDKPENAVEAVRQALSLDPQNQDALDVAAALAENEEPALLLVSAVREALPESYAHEEYDSVLRSALEKANRERSEVGDALLASVDLWNGDMKAARQRIEAAKALYASSRWPSAFEGQLEAKTGAEAEAVAILAEVADSLQSARLTRPWEVAALRPSSVTYGVLAARTEKPEHVRAAETLIAAVTPSDPNRFPWERPRGGLYGVITADGSVLPGAVITVIGPDGVVRTTTAGPGGEYQIDAPPGAYHVTAELSGMQSVWTRTIITGQGTAANLAFTRPSSVGEALTVTAEAPVIDVNTSTISTTYSLARDPIAEQRVVISGAPGDGFSNSYVVDGVNGAGPLSTRSGDALSFPSFFEEVTMVTAGPGAGSAQPSINAVSRSGGNDFHGDAYLEGRPASFRTNAEPLSVPAALHARRDERAARASLSGPFVRDRLWFYVFGDLRSIDGAPDEQRKGGSGTSKVTEVFAKINASLHPSWSTALSLNRSGEARSGVVDDIAGAAFGDSSSTHRRGELDSTTGLLSVTGTVTSSSVVEFRGSSQRGHRSLRPESNAGNTIQQREVLNSFFTRQGVGIIDDGRQDRRTNAIGLVSFIGGAVTIHIGGAYDLLRERVRDRLSGGRMEDVVPVDGRLITIIPRVWLLNGVALTVNESSESESSAAHVHQKLDIGRLVIDAGVRWDRQSVQFPSGHRVATKVLQPRVGVVFDPTGDGRSRLSASYARYAEPLTVEELVAFGSRRRYGAAETAYGGLDSIDPELQGRSTNELSASAAREFLDGPAVQITAVHRRLRTHVEDYLCTVELHRCVGNPGRGRMGGPAARREVTSLEAGAWDESDVELAGNDIDIEWRLTYTWFRGTGNVEAPDIASTRVVGVDPYARTAFDVASLVPPGQPLARERQHTVVGSAALRFDQPYADGPFMLGLWARWRSGEPLGRYGYSDMYGRYVLFLLPRGSEGRTPDVLESDVSLTYTRPVGGDSMQIGVAVSNALDRQTMLTADQRWSFSEASNRATAPENPNYLEAMTRLPPRSIRVFAKFTF